MRIGLVRHFPVVEPLPSGWMTAAELMSWRVHYEASPAVIGTSDLGSQPWSACLSSDLPRALLTAKAVFPGDVEVTPLLREVEFVPFATGKLPLPVNVWLRVFQLAWLFGHRSQRACRDDFLRRVNAVADRLESQTVDTLVVSHAGMMIYLSAELRRRGFTGPKLRIPRHAMLYEYRRDGK